MAEITPEQYEARTAAINAEAAAIAAAAAAQAENAAALREMAAQMATPAPTSRQAVFLACLNAAAQARIENEPALLFAAAKSLLASVEKEFPA